MMGTMGVKEGTGHDAGRWVICVELGCDERGRRVRSVRKPLKRDTTLDKETP